MGAGEADATSEGLGENAEGVSKGDEGDEEKEEDGGEVVGEGEVHWASQKSRASWKPWEARPRRRAMAQGGSASKK